MTADDTVWVAYRQRARRYHTSTDCTRIPDDPASHPDYRASTRAALEPHYTECQICQDGEAQNGGNMAYYNSLADAEAEDVP